MKAHRGKHIAPSQKEEWKLLYFIFKRRKFNSHYNILPSERLNENSCQNQSREKAGVPLNSDFVYLKTQQCASYRYSLNFLTPESHLCHPKDG